MSFETTETAKIVKQLSTVKDCVMVTQITEVDFCDEVQRIIYRVTWQIDGEIKDSDCETYGGALLLFRGYSKIILANDSDLSDLVKE